MPVKSKIHRKIIDLGERGIAECVQSDYLLLHVIYYLDGQADNDLGDSGGFMHHDLVGPSDHKDIQDQAH